MSMRNYIVFIVQRTVKLYLFDEPCELKRPNLVCVYSGYCSKQHAQKLVAKYPEAYYVEATKP